jgi:hypothetical protein
MSLGMPECYTHLRFEGRGRRTINPLFEIHSRIRWLSGLMSVDPSGFGYCGVVPAQVPSFDRRHAQADRCREHSPAWDRRQLRHLRLHQGMNRAETAVLWLFVVMCAVRRGIVTVDNNNDRFHGRPIVEMLEYRRQQFRHGAPSTCPNGWEAGLFCRCSSDQRSQERTNRGFVNARFADNDDVHVSRGTPPRMPLYQRSPKPTSPSNSFESVRSLRRTKLARPSFFSEMTTCSG